MPRDAGAEATDKILASLERRIRKEYGQAAEEAEAKWKKYMDSFDVADKKEAARLDAGEITKQEYQAWRDRHLAQGKHWEEMKDVIAKDYHNANLIAARMTNDTMADVYALNANYGTYLVEHGAKIDTGFTLYNHDSAEALLKEQWAVSPEKGENSFLPKPSEKKKRELAQAKQENPDVLWNKQKLQSVMMQGVLSGEPLTALASRLASVAQMDANQAIRNARTMTTNVQSKGRMDSFDRAAKLGVDLMDEWNSILDGATRHSHRHMHGERKPHDSKKPFSNGCRWPGDPSGPAAEVYNCRCRVIAWVKGFEGETVKKNPGMGDMSFEEWQNAKAPKMQETPKPAKPYSNKQEYESYKKQMQEGWKARKVEIEEENAAERERILNEDYGGPFMKQRIAVRTDETLTDAEKEHLLEEINKKRLKYQDEVVALGEKYSKYLEEEARNYVVFDMDYEYKRLPALMTAKENAGIINPNFFKGTFEYTNNCQRCAMAFESRMRGYDVIALPCDSYGGLGSPAEIRYAFQTAERMDVGGGREAIKEILKQAESWGDGGRGIIAAQYSGGGHAFNIINEKGTVYFVDPQCGSVWGLDEYTPDDIYGSVIERATHTTVYRTDNARLFNIPDGWVKNR